MKSLVSLLHKMINIFKTDKSKADYLKLDKPLYVEFIGASGVGKSTLYSELRKNKKTWLEVREFMKMNPVNSNIIFDRQEIYQRIAALKLELISNQKLEATDKFRIIHWGYRTLIEDTAISRFNQNATVISEEGLLHNFGDVIELLSDTNELNLKEIIKNRAIIYCYNSAENIVNHIKNRESTTGRIVSHHKNKTDEELLQIIQQELKNKETFVKFLEANQLPVLKINTSQDFQENLNKAIHFIENLQKKRKS